MSLRRYSLILLAAAPVVLAGCPGQHTQGVVEVMSDDCVTCHGSEAAAVEDPPHLGIFPVTCFECHNVAAWKPATFSHQNLVSTCYTCHRLDYEGVAEPPHVDELPQTCEECHTTDAWMPSIFSHDEVAGACYDCHRSDYEGTQNPSHVEEGYPQTCDDCHGTEMWVPALDGFRHPESFFPITEGPHKELTCLECHDPSLGRAQAGDNTNCVGCHTGQHAREKVDDQHSGVIDYAFDTTDPHFCLECHPSGLR